MTKPFERKLSDEQVDAIVVRAEAGEDREDLAEEFGVSVVYVGQLGRTRRLTAAAVALVQEGATRLAGPAPAWL